MRELRCRIARSIAHHPTPVELKRETADALDAVVSRSDTSP